MQKGLVIWISGLPGSGKSILALNLEKKLVDEGFLTEVLDGDKIRNGLTSDLTFSEEDRRENIRRIAEVSKLFCNAGIITISAFISPSIEMRQMARGIIKNEDFFEVYVSTSLKICEQRDTKGLYKKAREGVIKDFTGISAPYETPLNPDVNINTAVRTIEECTEEIFEIVIQKVRN